MEKLLQEAEQQEENPVLGDKECGNSEMAEDDRQPGS